MAPDQSYGAKLSTRVATNRASALEGVAYEMSTPHESVDRSELVREAIDCYLYENWEQIPEDKRDSLDRDVLKEARDEIIGEEVEA